MPKYIIKVVTTDGSKITWNADSEKEKCDMLENIMKSEGYIESSNDYGFLYINREHVVAIEVHDLK
ncbi:hypothetical protein [Mammaliicoccus sp. E-M24]|uniref:hypothetical protein n=1 Tax=Mammaliicoccus sp. E-M24 TaxID=2898684 RepID=UPI001EFBADD3|nr:hypothetical protein [Mammaliicoccus sp. E-M24]